MFLSVLVACQQVRALSGACFGVAVLGVPWADCARCWLQFIFGYGVGGEYPLASSSAAERAEASKALRFRRGEMVVCTFSMQVRHTANLPFCLFPNFANAKLGRLVLLFGTATD